MSDTESDNQLEPIRDSHVDKEKSVELPAPKEPESRADTTAEKVTTVNETKEDTEKSETKSEDTPKAENPKKEEILSSKPSESKNSNGVLKIRKRTIDTANSNNGFSRRPQSNPSFSRREQPQSRSQTPVSRFNVPSSAKPSWLDEKDLEKVKPVQVEQDSQQEERQLKRPTLSDENSNGGYQSREYRARRENLERSEEEIQQDIMRKTRDIDYTVRQHYNRRTAHSKWENRDSSPIIKLKNYNNAIKYILINNATKSGDRVLDLGCGKGGDLHKYTKANVSEYVGIDISNASISEAIRRYRKSGAKFQVTFITGDCFGQPLPVVLQNSPEIRFPFDVVSLQFCMHYAFENEQKVRMLLENVTKSLKPGGLFIGTIPSSDFIREKIIRLPPGTKQFGNSVYKVTFAEQPPKDGYFEETYGNTYNYYLQDAIDNVPEYVVPFEEFRSLAMEYGLKLRFKKTFTELFMENIPVWRNKLGAGMMRHLQRTDGGIGIQGEEAEATAFYLAFEFLKVE